MLHVPTLLIHGENRARAMGEKAEDLGLDLMAGQFRELAELFCAAKVAHDDFVHDKLIEQS